MADEGRSGAGSGESQSFVGTASRLFRAWGLDGIGVADLMKSAGLTHGGFYGHFPPKEEDLMAKACVRALEESLAKWRTPVETAPDHPLRAMAALYLSESHCAHPGEGCAIAALGSEAARQGAPVRHAMTEGLRRFIDLLAKIVGPPTHRAHLVQRRHRRRTVRRDRPQPPSRAGTPPGDFDRLGRGLRFWLEEQRFQQCLSSAR